MRISRTQKGKEYAYVYDFIYDHGMFFSQFYKSQRIEYKECRWNVESYCTSYDNKKINEFINKLIDKFWFTTNVELQALDVNNITETNLQQSEMIII